LPIFAYAALVDQKDGTILDDSSNLQWTTQLFGPENWAEATTEAAASEYNDFTDWRLPTLAELNALVDSSYWPQIDPVFSMGSGISNWMQWTSGTIDDENFVISDRAYTVFFDDGTDRSVPKTNHFYYRIVRDFSGGEVGEPMMWDTSDTMAWTTGGDHIEWD